MRSHGGIELPPQPDELFSSWLSRIALTLGCDSLTLTGNIWPRWRVWMLDSDRGLPPGRAAELSNVLNIPENAYKDTWLYPIIAATTTLPLPKYSTWPWLLALGSRNRKRHGGLSYCPVCLAQDKSPYYRRSWRLAWHTVCEKHACLLRDACPHCSAPLEPHRLSISDKDLTTCARCKGDLKKSPSIEPPANALSFQTTADRYVLLNDCIYGTYPASSKEWFALARRFHVLLRIGSLGKSAGLNSLFKVSGIEPSSLSPTATGLHLELLPVAERAKFLGNTWLLLKAGPDALLHALRYDGIPIKALNDLQLVLPASLKRATGESTRSIRQRKRRFSKPGLKPRSLLTVSRMMARLQRKMIVDSQ